MSVLNKKLTRDLSRLRGQVITIALVVACGIAGFVTLRGTFSSLKASQATYYETYRFADVFATLRRAPKSLSTQLKSVDGLAQIDLRVVRDIQIPFAHRSEPARARITSLPPTSEPLLNSLFMRKGRYVEPYSTKEVVVDEDFAKANELDLGSSIPAVIGGKYRELVIVGIALSPEYVFPIPPGEMMPDPKRFGLLWMDEQALSGAFNMEGAFNDFTATLQPGADQEEVIEQLDRLFEPYGVLFVVGRDRQFSHFALEGELAGLENNAKYIPIIFLSVAAFLLNIVLARLVNLQRGQIATLKAVGYSGLQVGLHYLALVTVIVALGSAIGLAGGIYLGKRLTILYAEFFRFPILIYKLGPDVLITGGVVSFAASAIGALTTVKRVASLPPAEAMRPPAPTRYRPGILERLGLGKLLSPAGVMVLRELERRPWRLLLSSLGIAAAIGIMVVGRFSYDAFDYMIKRLIHEEQPAELAVDLVEPVPESSKRILAHLPGVISVEGMRAVPIRIRSGSRWRDGVVSGIDEDSKLRRVINSRAQEVPLPDSGIMLSEKLAEILDLQVGQEVDIEIRSGQRQKRRIQVAATIDDTFGLQGYMQDSALTDFLQEEPSINRVYLRIDVNQLDDLQRRLKALPMVANVTFIKQLIDRWQEQSGNTMWVFTLIMTFFAMTIAIGVVYNNARVALSMRARDLASLRVLGFTRREISSILLSELAVQVLVAIPIGLLLGKWWSQALMAQTDPEVYRLPTYISIQTYAFAASVALLAGIASALLVRRKLDRLDLIAVLKTR